MIDTITNSVLNSRCFAWHPYGRLELFKTELVISCHGKNLSFICNRTSSVIALSCYVRELLEMCPACLEVAEVSLKPWVHV